jgi:hypothetical protein
MCSFASPPGSHLDGSNSEALPTRYANSERFRWTLAYDTGDARKPFKAGRITQSLLLKLVKNKKEVIIFVSDANSKFLRACIPRPVGWISMQ